MNIKQFIEEITQGGAKLWVEGDDLCCEGSSGVLTPEVLDILKQHKTELLSLLRKAVTEPEEYPLSHGQQALWFVHQNAIDSAAYNVAATLRICSKVDSAAMKRTFQFLLDRHPVLRAVFPVQDGQPHIRIQPKQNVWFETIDASDWNEEQLKQQVIQAYQRPYDLAQGPLMRVHMFSHTEQDHVLLITVHHIVFDGWSLWLFMDEFSQTYPAIAMGQTPALPKLQYSYRDYVQWQTDILAGPEGERLWQYWQKQLSGELPVLQLPTDRPRPPVQTYHGATHFFQLDETLTQQLKVLAQTFDTTLFSLLLATFQILLYRYTGQDDILVGIPTAGRNNTNFSGIVGYFVNPVVLRTHCAGNPDFKTFLKKVRDTVLAAIDHQDYPFPLLVERLQPKRMPSYSPLFQVDFALQKAQVGDLTDFSAITSDSAVKMNLGGLEVKPFVIPQQEGQFDLTLEIIESGNALSGNFKYNIDLFNADTIERMIGHFKVLLKGIVQNPQQPITALPLLTAAEQQQLLAWNDTFVDYPHDKTIVNLFEEQVDKTPDAIAVVFEDQQLTYQELNTKANQLAHYLLNLKTGTDNCSLITDNCLVGICVERSLEMMIGLLGILKAGGAYVPLDPAYPAARLAFMLDDAQVPVLLTQSSLKEKLPETQALVVCLDAEAETFSQYRSENVASGVGPENLAYVIYTSGSTGKPKGVLVRHFNVARLFTATQSWFHFHERDVWTFFHSYAFDFSVWELWGALLYGGSLVVVPYWISRSPEAFYELLKTKGVTVLNQTPSAFRQLMTAEDQKGNRSDLNLRLVIFGGEALEFQSLTPWFERHGDQIPQLVNMYGITETTVHVTYRPLTLADLNSQGSLIGFPIPDLQAYMLDSHLQPTPIGIPGELHIGGAGLARGYLNRPELTAEKFIKNPFSDDPNSRLYKTGDLARYLPDGNIEYLGRIDNQVKMRGFRIELGEIEAILVQHPAVQENAVIVHELESGDKRLVACLVPNQGQTIDNTELRSFLK
ncbi:MAG: non-ribosomal peptide synthetase, partial [Candidatus Parabeggiatoa sp. nov. 3]